MGNLPRFCLQEVNSVFQELTSQSCTENKENIIQIHRDVSSKMSQKVNKTLNMLIFIDFNKCIPDAVFKILIK